MSLDPEDHEGDRLDRQKPSHILIVPDDWAARHVGRLSDGRQFFVTTPFDPLGTGVDFVARYLFDGSGQLIDATIEPLGVRDAADARAAGPVIKAMLGALGPFDRVPISVAPFVVERFDLEFGLIPEPPEDEDDCWSVLAMPGDYMAFMPPWDGDYDT